MTKDDLARDLDHLDPGATLVVDEPVLAAIFGAGSLSAQIARAVEAFALEHRCSFTYQEHGRVAPCFAKNDIF